MDLAKCLDVDETATANIFPDTELPPYSSDIDSKHRIEVSDIEHLYSLFTYIQTGEGRNCN